MKVAVVLLTYLCMVYCDTGLQVHGLNDWKVEHFVSKDSMEFGRSMVINRETGTVYVGSFDFQGLSHALGNRVVYAIIDENKDAVIDRVIPVTPTLSVPNGVAYFNGTLYVAQIDKILRYDGIDDWVAQPAPAQFLNPTVVLNNTFMPSLQQYDATSLHGWRYIRISPPPENRLYLAIGATCNVPGSVDPDDTCIDSPKARMWSFDLNDFGSRKEVARGIRNSVGFDWQPETKQLYFTDNGRDYWRSNPSGDYNTRPPDELNRVPLDSSTTPYDFGFPKCYGKGMPDLSFNPSGQCDFAQDAVQELEPHVAALGMRFYTGDMFPELKGDILIAEHGSWNRNPPGGYRVTRVRTFANGSTTYEPFVTGWLNLSVSIRAWGRPADVEIYHDGSILVSDEWNGIYRIYRDKQATPTQEPTGTPTQEPTDAPTEEPTDTPTQVPTEAPTQQFTTDPPLTPTEETSKPTTSTPTMEPSVQPTTSSDDIGDTTSVGQEDTTPILVVGILSLGLTLFVLLAIPVIRSL